MKQLKKDLQAVSKSLKLRWSQKFGQCAKLWVNP